MSETVTRREALEELAKRRARENLSSFVLYNHDDYIMGWFHREICRALKQFALDVIAKKSPRLIITAPPRSGKSQLVSRDFPAWFLGNYPESHIIASSYSSDLAGAMNTDVQRIIDGPRFRELFPFVFLASKEAAAKTGDTGAYKKTTDKFEIVHYRGSYRSAGVGGGITGMGADVLIIDDPHKDKAEAYSATMRSRVHDWYASTAYTRLAPGGGVIVMCTRWHTDDLVGHLLEKAAHGGDQYHVINYPAIAEHDEKYRKEGEALHPERYNLLALTAIKAQIGSELWAAMYQQHPVPEGGGTFKKAWIQYYKELPPFFDKKVLSWDMTFKDSKTSDYVVGSCWGRYQGSFYLIDQVRGRWDFVETLQRFCDFARKHSGVIRKLVEEKANGAAIISALKKQVTGLIPINPTESKEARASAIATLWEAHNVYIPSPEICPWVQDFTAELLSFPAGVHDDQVDSMTQALSDLQTGGRISADNMAALRVRR